MKGALFRVLAFLCALYVASPTLAAPRLAMDLGHFADQLEFYYQKPRPRELPRIVERMEQMGALKRADGRLLVAAFLAELARAGKIDLATLGSANASRERRHTLAWSARLAGNPDYSVYLTDDDAALKKQLAASPSSLKDWPAEATASRMRLAAFGACGDAAWIEQITDVALANGSGAGTARAILYDATRRHPLVRARLKARLEKARGNERELLWLILGEK